MFRTTLGLCAVAILAAVAGCTMCCHPYDNCGPVWDGGECQTCSPHYRAGSIFAGTPDMAMSSEKPHRDVQATKKTASRAAVPTRAQPDSKPGDVPGAERILSVTDRVVKPAEGSVDSQVVSESSSSSGSSAQPLPANGWTARRPTAESTQ
jgi:hypothetical protein